MIKKNPNVLKDIKKNWEKDRRCKRAQKSKQVRQMRTVGGWKTGEKTSGTQSLWRQSGKIVHNVSPKAERTSRTAPESRVSEGQTDKAGLGAGWADSRTMLGGQEACQGQTQNFSGGWAESHQWSWRLMQWLVFGDIGIWDCTKTFQITLHFTCGLSVQIVMVWS